mgnify:CR=1 FL=1
MERSAQSVRLAGSFLSRSCHVCAFFHSKEEEYQVLMPFIKEGFENGDRAFHVVDPKHRRALGDQLLPQGLGKAFHGMLARRISAEQRNRRQGDTQTDQGGLEGKAPWRLPTRRSTRARRPRRPSRPPPERPLLQLLRTAPPGHPLRPGGCRCSHVRPPTASPPRCRWEMSNDEPAKRTRAPFELGCRPSPARITPALTSSSL